MDISSGWLGFISSRAMQLVMIAVMMLLVMLLPASKKFKPAYRTALWLMIATVLLYFLYILAFVIL